jgi:beta-glucosidase/6-phospho-beta-glucosidase/beta-galactosidase
VAGHQVEGRFNGPRQPENDWAEWERQGKAEPAGEAVRFWEEPERLLDLAAGIGLNAFRTSIEWTRLQPRKGADLRQGAVDRYAAILAAARRRGLEPMVTLHHFTHPAWLGTDFWLEAEAPGAFAAFAEEAARRVGRAMADAGAEPVRWWVTVNEPNILGLLTYVFGAFPNGGTSLEKARRAQDHLMAGHTLAYRAVHRVYASEGWPPPMVSFNTYELTAYGLGRALVDLGAARQAGVPRGALDDLLAAERPRWTAEVGSLGPAVGVLADRAVERTFLPDIPAAYPAYIDALYADDGASHDYLAIDYYTPVAADQLRSPLASRRHGREIPVMAQLWESTIRPEGLRMFLHAHHRRERPLPIVVAENGMSTRVRGSMRRSRPDGWRRPAFIKAHVGEMLQAARGGVPVAGYFHWSLVDNYEWGSYEPRFGLLGVDRRRGADLMPTDADGDDSAGTYRTIVDAARSADGSALATSLQLD